MAFSTNNIISQNKTLTPLTLPFPKHPKFSTLHPASPFLHIRPSNSRMAISAAKTISDVELQHNNSTLDSATTNAWSEFAANVSGEWDGYGADFTAQGKPIELPEYVVPEAYREWEVKVFDWQTQCPTLAQPEDRLLTYKLIKLLPTVGCEADAATRYSIDEREIGGVSYKVSAFAYQSSGCYVAVWPTEEKHETSRLIELEHCLVDPGNRESRVRVIQVVGVANSRWVLRNIKVFCEQWYGPFRNGEQLGGCAIRDSAFASTDALKGTQVGGVWQGPAAVASFQSSHTNFVQELLEDSVRQSVRDESNVVLLPKQLWCSLKEREGGEICSEVGWLLDHGRAITSTCLFSSDAKLKEIAIARETAASEVHSS
ncbi:hypothetical protein L1049_014823 [Liquidambar formosana]|uniref:Uncharacterized protein n=1 Tax=Liquidambar formosana TaxID=63359 RepID=A0AAP0S2N6_LIQFO